MNSEEEITGDQVQNSVRSVEHLKPWQYKKGQSGNPSGRPEGISLKEYARMKFRHMSDTEREEFLQGIDKKTIWEMGEDKAKQGAEISGSISISQVLDELENGQAPS